MEILGDLIKGLIVTFIIYLISEGSIIFIRKIQLSFTKYFWKPFVKGKRTLVIIGHIEELNHYERSGLIGYGDAVALAELKSYFDSLNLKNVDIKYDKDVSGDDLKSNLVLLGGPQTNTITRDALSKIHCRTLNFKDSNSYVGIHDADTDEWHEPLVSFSGDVSIDYGLIVRSVSPFDDSKKVVVIAGSWGYGTWAGVRLSISKNFNKTPDVLIFDSFECLVKSDIVLKTPQNIKAIYVREIKPPTQNLDC